MRNAPVSAADLMGIIVLGNVYNSSYSTASELMKLNSLFSGRLLEEVGLLRIPKEAEWKPSCAGWRRCNVQFSH